ncbi:MAG: hypothetical protein O6913_00730 [Chloroflexi bacterium]|nr:hypothetical protein [Chloroflexota bacterium]MCZ6708493.1 hypothetical protein [Chloroflexota bacterium]
MTTHGDLLPHSDLELFEVAAYRSIYTEDRPLVRKDTRDQRVVLANGDRSLGRPRCDEEQAIELDASAVTDHHGKVSILLSNYVCGPILIVQRPVTFLATPASGDQAIFLTCSIDMAPTLDDVTATVYSWAPGGELVGDIPFSWRIRLRYVRGRDPIIVD